MRPVVLALEVLGLLLLAGSAGAAGWMYVAPWAGLLAAAVVVLLGAGRGEQLMTRGR